MHNFCIGSKKTVGTAGYFVAGHGGIANSDVDFADYVHLGRAHGVEGSER